MLPHMPLHECQQPLAGGTESSYVPPAGASDSLVQSPSDSPSPSVTPSTSPSPSPVPSGSPSAVPVPSDVASPVPPPESAIQGASCWSLVRRMHARGIGGRCCTFVMAPHLPVRGARQFPAHVARLFMPFAPPSNQFRVTVKPLGTVHVCLVYVRFLTAGRYSACARACTAALPKK